jgi:hypothetical protein
MEYISVTQFAEKFGIAERTARNYCAAGKIEGAFLTGKTWNIPADAGLPQRGRSKKKKSPLLTALQEPNSSCSTIVVSRSGIASEAISLTPVLRHKNSTNQFSIISGFNIPEIYSLRREKVQLK